MNDHLLQTLSNSHNLVMTHLHQHTLSAEKLLVLADQEAQFALNVQDTPQNPVEHVCQAHAQSQAYLARLHVHSPNVFASIHFPDQRVYRFTPRKTLRRVLDHTLDHLNQIEQWLNWQNTGNAPTPTDGWVGSNETLGEDTLPLTERDLAAWLWRIDVATELLINHAEQLSDAQLDWQPPNGGWTLRFVLHHVAVSEVFYSAWFDETLPLDPLKRYQHTNDWLRKRLIAVSAQTRFYISDELGFCTADQLVQELLLVERQFMEADLS
jgi:DinB superfamily